jgi:hypothetical protein
VAVQTPVLTNSLLGNAVTLEKLVPLGLFPMLKEVETGQNVQGVELMKRFFSKTYGQMAIKKSRENKPVWGIFFECQLGS